MMSKRLVNREELGKLITKTSGAISMIDDSHYIVRSTSGDNTYTITATQSGWVCSCLDYARHNGKCKHIYAVKFYRNQSTHVKTLANVSELLHPNKLLLVVIERINSKCES